MGFILVAALTSFVAAGSVADSIGAAQGLVTPDMTYVGSAFILLVWILVEFWVRWRGLRWMLGGTSVVIRRVRPLPRAAFAGVLLLLWVPRVPIEAPPSDSSQELQSKVDRTLEMLERIDAKISVGAEATSLNYGSSVPQNNAPSGPCSGVTVLGDEVQIPLTFAIRPMKDLRSTFVLEPTVSDRYGPMCLRPGQTSRVSMYFSAEALFAQLRGLPENAFDGRAVSPGEVLRFRLGVTNGVDRNQFRVLAPEGATVDGEMISWTPSPAQAGTRQFAIVLTDVPGVFVAPYTMTNPTTGERTQGETRLDIPNAGFLARIAQLIVRPYASQVHAHFEPVEGVHSVFKLSRVDIALENRTDYRLSLPGVDLDLGGDLDDYLKGLPDESVITYEVPAGELLRLSLPDRSATFLKVPPGSVVSDGSRLEWLAVNEDVGEVHYLVINSQRGVTYRTDLGKGVHVDDAIPGIFFVMRLAVVGGQP